MLWLIELKGVGTVRAIFGHVQDTAVFVIFCLNMLYVSKNWCFKSIFLVFYILGLKVQKTTKNHRFLEKFNIFYIVMSKEKLLSPYVRIKQLHSYKYIILTFAEQNCLFLGKKHQILTFFHRFLEIFYIFLVSHDSTVNELWFDITLGEASKQINNLVICSEEDLRFGEKTSIFDTFSQIYGNIL